MAAANAISFKDLCIDAVNPEVLATFLGVGARASRRAEWRRFQAG